jgi:uncharacterized YkwD family protein
MIRKLASSFIATFLIVALSACSMTDNENALDYSDTNNDFATRDTAITDREGLQDYGRNVTITDNVNYRSPNLNEMDQANGQYNRQADIERELKSDISADMTDMSSQKYPHTKAILIQEAKYKHVKIDPSQAKQFINKMVPGNIQSNQGATGQKQAPPANKQQQAGKQPGSVAQGQAQPKAGQAAPQQQQPAAENAVPQQQQQQEQAKAPEQPAKEPSQATAGLSEFESKVIELTNAERRKNGLPDLKGDTSLSKVAREKSNDMQKNNYFSHTSPTYGSPFDMMRDFGITYNSAGENIAQGQRSPEEVVKAWMNSEGHRKNILSSKFTHIGVGHETGGNHWTQMFIGK